MILKVLTTEGVYQTFSSKKHNEKIIVKIISELKKKTSVTAENSQQKSTVISELIHKLISVIVSIEARCFRVGMP